MIVSGEEAYGFLREAIKGKKDPNSFECEDPPYERLRKGLTTEIAPLDLALRLRHVLRYADLKTANPQHLKLLPLPPGDWWKTSSNFENCGLKLRHQTFIEAESWRPKWLPNIPEHGVDAVAMMAEPRPWLKNPPPADPWVKEKLGIKEYRGPGQALAVRSVLNMPNDKALLVVLPTGEGKSLIFQALAVAHPGMTVAVVVPTVSLAQNHQDATLHNEKLLPNQPHAYIGGEDVNNDLILRSVEDGSQGLLFAAPEAFVGRLRTPLINAAKNGKLAAVVIDEAHLVDAWGTDFRSEFQLLPALVGEIREASQGNNRPRAICLSATVTQSTFNTLNALFRLSTNEDMSVISAMRLRPEPDIWISQTCDGEDDRDRKVMEALKHLPRPALLYVTRPIQAVQWKKKLKDGGFGSVGMVHGATSYKERKRVVASWRKGELDIVVGTSAFGVGIDYAHARTVIHACVPESLDRYYQEIGRTGRDNCASIAVIIPERSDFEGAKTMARQKIISVELGYRRWKSMFEAAQHDEVVGRVWVDLATPAQYNPDMYGTRHEDWNARVLSLMVRAGLIRIAGLKYDAELEKTLLGVYCDDDRHLQRDVWDDIVEKTRGGVQKYAENSYTIMVDMLKSSECLSRSFSKLYMFKHANISATSVLACGGCPSCHQKNRTPFTEGIPVIEAPWGIGSVSTGLAAYCNERNVCLIERGFDIPSSRNDQRLLRGLIAGFWDAGIRKWLILGDAPKVLYEALSANPWIVSHRINDLQHRLLPVGPEVVWIGRGFVLPTSNYDGRVSSEGRFFILPSNPENPDIPDRKLRDNFVLTPIDLILKEMEL